MYSQRELIVIAAAKSALRRRIGRRRAECVRAAAGIARPFALVNHAIVRWRRIAPWVGLSVAAAGFLLPRAFRPRPRVLGTLLRWGSLLAGVTTALRSARSATTARRST